MSRSPRRPRGAHLGAALITIALAGGLAGCGGDDPQAAPATAPATSPSPSPSVSATPEAEPLSPYEDDPAVKVLRQYYAGAAYGVNTKNFDNRYLTPITTAAWRAKMKVWAKKELGDRYPGPIPFTPIDVARNSATKRTVLMCVFGDGWLQDRKTGEPTLKRKVYALRGVVVKDGGRWRLVSNDIKKFSCKGIDIPEVEWS